ncbi:hypothetical protein AB9X41_24390, partial [Ralstonia solanacearum]
MNGADCVIPAIISPLVGRHTADAAFYWLQLDQSIASFQLTPARYRLFNSRLDAHLVPLHRGYDSLAGLQDRQAVVVNEQFDAASEACLPA